MKTKLLICIFFWSIIHIQAQTPKIDSLKQNLMMLKPNQQYMDVLNELAFEYIALTYDSSLNYTQKAEFLSRKLNYYGGESQSLNIRGIVYRMQGNYEKAMEYHLQGLKIAETHKTKQIIANHYSNIGLVFFEKEDYKNALENFNKALKIKNDIQDKRGIAFTSEDIGKIYEKQAQWDKALLIYQQALQMWKNLKDKNREANIDNNIGRLYLAQNQFNKAHIYFIQAMKVARQFKDQILIADTYNNAAKVYFLKKNYLEAIKWHQQALEIAKKISHKISIQQAYEGLSKSFAALKEFNKAYQYQEMAIVLKDSLSNQENLRRISSLHFSYELEKKDKIINNQILLRNSLLIGSSLVLLLFIFLLRANLYSRNLNSRLKIQKQEIENKNAELLLQTEEIASQRDLLAEQNTQIIEADKKIKSNNEMLKNVNHKLEELVTERTQALQKTNTELDLLIYRASHDLKAPLTTFIGLANLGKIEQNRDDQLTLFHRIEFVAMKMSRMLDKLHKVSYLNSKKIKLQEVDFEDILDEVKMNLHRIIQKYQAKIHLQIEAMEMPISDPEILVTILENIVENAIYFRKESLDVLPEIYIDVDSHYSFLSIKVKDNGIGIHEKHFEKVYDMFFIGSDRSKGNGLGMYLVKKALLCLEGKIEIKSNVDEYTEFTITLPQSQTTEQNHQLRLEKNEAKIPKTSNLSAYS